MSLGDHLLDISTSFQDSYLPLQFDHPSEGGKQIKTAIWCASYAKGFAKNDTWISRPYYTQLFLATCATLLTHQKKSCATITALDVFEKELKWAIFENQSTTTSMESCCLLVLESPSTKSILISFHGAWGTGNGVYTSYSVVAALPIGMCDTALWSCQHPSKDWANKIGLLQKQESCLDRNDRLLHQHGVPKQEIP